MNVTARFESAEAIPGLCTLAFAKPLARATLAAFTIAGPAPGAAVVPPVTTSTSAQMVITDPAEFTKFAGHAMAHKTVTTTMTCNKMKLKVTIAHWLPVKLSTDLAAFLDPHNTRLLTCIPMIFLWFAGRGCRSPCTSRSAWP